MVLDDEDASVQPSEKWYEVSARNPRISIRLHLARKEAAMWLFRCVWLMESLAAASGFGLVALGSDAFAQSPELPREFVDASYVSLSGQRIHVAAGGNLQAAINAAQPGDTIELEAGAGCHGQFTHPAQSLFRPLTIATYSE